MSPRATITTASRRSRRERGCAGQVGCWAAVDGDRAGRLLPTSAPAWPVRLPKSAGGARSGEVRGRRLRAAEGRQRGSGAARRGFGGGGVPHQRSTGVAGLPDGDVGVAVAAAAVWTAPGAVSSAWSAGGGWPSWRRRIRFSPCAACSAWRSCVTSARWRVFSWVSSALRVRITLLGWSGASEAALGRAGRAAAVVVCSGAGRERGLPGFDERTGALVLVFQFGQERGVGGELVAGQAGVAFAAYLPGWEQAVAVGEHPVGALVELQQVVEVFGVEVEFAGVGGQLPVPQELRFGGGLQRLRVVHCHAGER